MDRKALLIGASFGLLTVAFGAFGAHALKDLLMANGKLEVFETAVRYQAYHAFALLIVGMLSDKLKSKWINRSVPLLATGVVVFSGSLYVLSISNIGLFGAVTPIGGVLLIGGWISLIVGVAQKTAS